MILLFALLLGMCIVALANNTIYLEESVLFVILLFSIVYTFEILKSKKYSKYAMPLLSGYFLRIIMLFYDIYTSNPIHLPEMGQELTSDMKGFYNAALVYSQGGTPNYGGLFSKVFGFIFYVTAGSRLWGQFIVLLFSIKIFFVVIKIYEVLSIPEKDIIKGLWVLCLLPNYIILSVIFRRESIIILFLAISIYYFTKWLVLNLSEKDFLISIIVALLASLFHGAVGLIAVGYVIIHLIYNPKNKAFNLNTNNLLFVLLISIAMLFFISKFGKVFFVKLDNLQEISDISSIRDAGGSSYAKYVGDSDSLSHLAIYALPRLLYFLFSPFPWQWRGFSDIIAFLMSSFVYIIIFTKAIYRLLHNKRRLVFRNELISYFIITLVITFVFSCGVTNTGTAMRHRDKFVVLYIIINTLSNKRYIV